MPECVLHVLQGIDPALIQPADRSQLGSLSVNLQAMPPQLAPATPAGTEAATAPVAQPALTPGQARVVVGALLSRQLLLPDTDGAGATVLRTAAGTEGSEGQDQGSARRGCLPLVQLDLSGQPLAGDAIRALFGAFDAPRRPLEVLGLSGCGLTDADMGE